VLVLLLWLMLVLLVLLLLLLLLVTGCPLCSRRLLLKLNLPRLWRIIVPTVPAAARVAPLPPAPTAGPFAAPVAAAAAAIVPRVIGFHQWQHRSGCIPVTGPGGVLGRRLAGAVCRYHLTSASCHASYSSSSRRRRRRRPDDCGLRALFSLSKSQVNTLATSYEVMDLNVVRGFSVGWMTWRARTIGTGPCRERGAAGLWCPRGAAPR